MRGMRELEGWCGTRDELDTRDTGPGVAHCRLFIHTFLLLAEAEGAVTSSNVQGDTQVRGSLRRDPTMSCQQIIASIHFLGSLFSDKTRDCIQPPPPALMPAIKTESSLHSSLSQLHFYGRNFQRSSSLNLPRFFHLSPSSICWGPGRARLVKTCSARVSSVSAGRRAGRVIGFLCN